MVRQQSKAKQMNKRCHHQNKKNSVKILYLPDLFILFMLRVLVSYKLNFYILTCSENLNLIISILVETKVETFLTLKCKSYFLYLCKIIHSNLHVYIVFFTVGVLWTQAY